MTQVCDLIFVFIFLYIASCGESPMNNSKIVTNVVTTSGSLVVTSKETLEIGEGKESGTDKNVENGITFDFYGPFSSQEKRLWKKLSPVILSVH